MNLDLVHTQPHLSNAVSPRPQPNYHFSPTTIGPSWHKRLRHTSASRPKTPLKEGFCLSPGAIRRMSIPQGAEGASIHGS